MKTITIVGLGPGPVAQLTKEAEAALLAAEKVFFRTCAHPVHAWLVEQGKHAVCFDRLYCLPWKASGEVYDFMVSALLKEADLNGTVTYALPGSPVFLEDTTRLLKERGGATGVEVRLVHGLSFVEEALGQLNLDFDEGLQVVLPWTHLEPGRFSPKLALLVCQIEAQRLPEDDARVDLTMKWLLKVFPADHPVTLIWTDGLPDYRTQTLQTELRNLAHEYGKSKYFASVYVPPLR
ncbi:MAG: SAM-dependent methyltransferase [Candidatus Acidiferrum sp.]|jgi:tetrapyrrole methylase family protein/MazG family protein